MPLLRDQKIQLRDLHGVPQGGMGLRLETFNMLTTMRNSTDQDRAQLQARLDRLVGDPSRMRTGVTPLQLPAQQDPQGSRGPRPLQLSSRLARHGSTGGPRFPVNPQADFLDLSPSSSSSTRSSVHLPSTRVARQPSVRRSDLIDFDWPHYVFEANQKGRRFLADDQVSIVARLVDGWSRFAAELIDASEKAEASIEKLVKEVSGARRARLAVGSKVVWLILTVAAPPPWGALIGALIRGALGTETWTDALKRWTEWGLQAPFPITNGKADFLGQWRPWVEGKETKSPPLNYIGGHPSLRELKDMHQVINHLDKAFTGKNKKLFDKYNENLFTKWLSLPPQPKGVAESAATILARECSRKGRDVQNAVSSTVFDYAANQTNAEELVHAVIRYQYDDIRTQIGGYSDPVRFVQHVVYEGIDLYLNTLGFHLIHRHTAVLDGGFIPRLNLKAVQAEFEKIILARYLVASRDLAPRRDGAGVMGVDEDYWLRVYGAVSTKVWTGEVETRLIDLGITRRYPGASIIGTGRTDEYTARIPPWRPPALRGPWEPVPYQGGGANARGRLAAWAVHYADRYDRAPETVLQTFLDARLAHER